MANVFCLYRSAFNDKHDREAAIIEGMFEKKYMLSALRSFAWTLAEKACIDERDISSYNFDELFSLGEFIKEREKQDKGFADRIFGAMRRANVDGWGFPTIPEDEETE